MKSSFLSLFVWIGAFLLTSCQTRTPNEPLAETPAATRYATLLDMQDLDHGRTLCRIANPWQPQRIAMQYLLLSESDTLLTDEDIDHLESLYGRVQMLYTPLRHQTITSACYAYLYRLLGSTQYIGTLCDVEYIQDSAIIQAVQSGAILDAGSSMSPNAEVILSTQSEAIWLTPYETGSQAMISAILPQIPVIYCADYLEGSPLGRAEWMRFFGRLVDKGRQADSLFAVVERNYREIASSQAQDSTHVSLLCELPYGATWYVPGGRSTMSWLYQDAGFQYIWADDTHSGSLALSAEAVYAKAQAADAWIIKYYAPESDWSLQDLLAQNPIYSQIHAAQSGGVFACNTARSDYFEVTPFRPDWILSEMRRIRRRELDSLSFFQQLQ